MWSNVRIRYKLMALVACAALALALASVGALAAIWNARLQERKDELKNISEIAVQIIKAQNTLTGSAPGESNLSRLSRLFSSISYNGGEYIFLISDDGTFLAHPKSDMIGRNYIDLKDKEGTPVIRNLLAASKKEGGSFTEYYWPRATNDIAIKKMTFSIGVPALGAFVGTGAYMDDLRAKFISDATIIVLVNLVILAGLGGLALLIARSISRPVAELVTVMSGMADGDLSINVPGRTRNDETGLLARAAEQMRHQLHALTSEVRAHAKGVYEAAQGTAMAVEAQAVTSSQMSASVTEITATMEEFSASSTQIAEYSSTVVDLANLTWDHSRKGAEAMELVTAKMRDTGEDNQNSLHEIIDLGSKSKEISKIMQIINAIADQTKLIAFNAALEAASAGDAGRRFGVVAAEIRRLADSVTESTSEIEGRISHIQDSINRLVITSEKGAKGIGEGVTAIAHTAERLNELVDAARQTTAAAEQISLSTRQQRTASNQVVGALREIVAASNHTAQSINQISDISKGTAQQSSDMERLVGRIRLASTALP